MSKETIQEFKNQTLKDKKKIEEFQSFENQQIHEAF